MTSPSIPHILQQARSYRGVDDERATLLFEQAAALARDARDGRLLADALNGLAGLEHARGDSHAALVRLREAHDLHRQVGNAAGQAAVLCNLGALYTDLGNYNTALEHLLAASTTLQGHDDPVRASNVAANLARVYEELQQPEPAEAHYRQALDLARANGHADGEMIFSMNYGDFQRKHGRYHHARRLLDRALALAGDRSAPAGAALHMLGQLHADEGDTDEALRAYDRALPLARAGEDLDAQLAIITSQAQAHLKRGAPAEARAALEDAIILAEDAGRHRTRAKLLDLLATAHAQEGAHARAYTVARRAHTAEADVLRAEADRQTRQLTTQYELERARQDLDAQRRKYDAEREAKEKAERETRERLVELERQALYDALTGLPNRLLLADRYRTAVEHASAHGERLTLGVIDLNKFKHINDTLGHHIGDLLLIEVARRLEPVIGPRDTVARTGGDEFVLILRDTPDDAAVLNAARRVVAAFDPTFTLETHDLNVRPSLGVAVYPDDARTWEDLFEHADKAMYNAKTRGSGFERHAAGDEGGFAPITLEGAVHHALALGQFDLMYQPLTLPDGRVRGAEALLRWEHPHFGSVPPGVFLPLAERTGLSVPIGAWVLQEACRVARHWDGRVLSVNLSPRQFTHPDLTTFVQDALDASGLSPHLLELEVSEEMLQRAPDRARAALTALRALGVRIVIDNFGAGFTSFAALKHAGVDGVKLDPALVRDLKGDGTHGRDEAMLEGVVRLAQAIHLDVIAKGVETPEQQAFLARLGVNAVQGFLFAHPQGAEAFARHLAAHPG
ncbi:EAL domain-containing protein [Deinococcus maricopensis]|uniref:Diguanylate cyclase/phosphodiesterase n=1 Tax=Deinococcus maricopensis (strain DSM 21211 / LMG 22137 / NRRL B-23946 / LB-34) TaxID=709986 RepID=E8U8X4_DEIML|nr:EAL domain-containing protein [Deinococcus maricopensis]ADV67513.1 diguanylate cyclase/phosphodiesterase [Deinococcus maricopensis DSM 21211]